MSSRVLRFVTGLSITWLFVLTVVSGCAGSDDRRAQTRKPEATKTQDTTTTYRLVGGTDTYPEGIAVYGSQYYVTSVGRGDIYRGTLGEPTAKVFIPSPGFGSAGIKATATRLVVVQGDEHAGIVTVFDRVSGDRLVRFSTGGEAGLNDVAIAPNGDAYVTDSDFPVLYRIPAAALRKRQDKVRDLPVFMSLRGTPFDYSPDQTNANGIVVSPDSKILLVVNFATGHLFRIRLADHKVTGVDLSGASLTGGDGMVLVANELYVVRNDIESVTKLAMGHGYAEGREVSQTMDPTFQKPTTAAIAGDRLLVVNNQYDGPVGKPPWTVSDIRLP
jgi:Cu-Zn family superoxide dismutase